MTTSRNTTYAAVGTYQVELDSVLDLDVLQVLDQAQSVNFGIKYNGVPYGDSIVGLGYPQIQAVVNSSVGFAVWNVTTVATLLASPVAGTYRATFYGVMTTAFAASVTGTALTLGWTDDSAAATVAYTAAAVTAGANFSGTQTFRSAANDAITYTMQYAAAKTTTAGVVALSIVLERIV